MSRPSTSLALALRSVGGTNVKTGDTRYRGRIAKSERPRDEHLEVLADHITGGRGAVCGLDWEGGELRPKGPTVGKEKPGIAFC